MGRAVNITVPLAAAAVVGAMLFVGVSAGGSTESRSSSEKSDVTAEPRAEPKERASAVFDPNDPASWKLPIESYMPTKAESRLVSGARGTEMDDCMAQAGYESWTPAPDLPEFAGKTLTDWRYGIHDLELAQERGYKPDAAEQQAYDAAMEAGAVDESGADDATLDSCDRETDSVVPTLPRSDLVEIIGADTFKQASQAPEVVEVFDEWSSCMRAEGYDYAKPMDANDDPRFANPDEISKLEIATATADIRCRDRYDVTLTWYEVEAEMQQEAIEDHRAELDADRSAYKAAIAEASKLTQGD